MTKCDSLEMEYLSKFKNLNFLCLTETWLTSESIHAFYLPGFRLSGYYVRTERRHGGVAVYCRDCIQAVPLDLDNHCVDIDFEICGCRINTGGAEMIVLVCYRSPSGNFATFLERLEAVLERLFRPRSVFVITGDFNVDPFRDSVYYSRLSGLLSSFNMSNFVNWPTRVSSGSLSTIDLVFCSKTTDGKSIVLDNCISDHRTVLFSYNYSEYLKPPSYKYDRSFNDRSVVHLVNALTSEDWGSLYSMDNVDEAYRSFFDVFYYYFDTFFPKRRKKIQVHLAAAWKNDDTVRSSQRLRDLHSLKSSFPVFVDAYKRAKREHSEIVRTAKKKYFDNLICHSSNPIRSAWHTVRLLSGRQRGLDSVAIVNDVNGELTDDPSSVAHLFNNFFIDAPVELSGRIGRTRNVDSMCERNSCSLYLFPFTPDEIYNVIRSKLKNSRSCGPDEVPLSLVRSVAGAICEPLCFIINLSFQRGVFPDLLKTSKVVPIPKGGDAHCLGSYRPIALSSSFSKIFEHCFLMRLSSFISRFDLLSEKQFGFREKRSTSDALVGFLTRIIRLVDAGECPVGLFCDLSRAFDCVDHTRLLEKLEMMGVRGVALAWLRDFLSGRRQFVGVRGAADGLLRTFNSSIRGVDLGVPQGSVLGPILFILYVNDIFAVHNTTDIAMYADDASLVLSDPDSLVLEALCCDSLSSINKWFSANNLYLNKTKTCYLRFHSRQRLEDLSIDVLVEGEHIAGAKSVKFLGVYIDSTLNWQSHCGALVSKLNSYCFLFRNLRSVLSEERMIMLYYAYVQSRLAYAITVWGGSAGTAAVFICQKRIIRAIFGIHGRVSCRPVFRAHRVLTLCGLYIFYLCLYVFRHRSEFPKNLNIHPFNTRMKNDFRLPHRRLLLGQLSPDARGLEFYNRLPGDIRDSSTESVFRRSLRDYLISECVYTVDEFLTPRAE